MSGCTMPCSLIESASSRSDSSEKSLRGWSGQGRMRANEARSTRSRVSVAGAAAAAVADSTGAGGGGGGGEAPSSALSPRPKAGFAMARECPTGNQLSTLHPSVLHSLPLRLYAVRDEQKKHEDRRLD